MTDRKTLSLPKRPQAVAIPVATAKAAPKKTAPASAPRTAAPSASGHPPRPIRPATPSSAKPAAARRAAPAGAATHAQGRKPAPAAPRVAGERLSKRVMQLKGCSRNEAEQYITSGFVRVDGVVVEDPPVRVAETAVVTISPDATLLAPQAFTFVVNKPPQWLDGVDDDEDTPSARRAKAPPSARTLLVAGKQWAQGPAQQAFLKRHTLHLEASVPLEPGASGLVVFTQDWRITRKLEEHLGEMEHEYMVDVAQAVSADQLQAITRLLKDPREQLPVAKASISSSTPTSTRLRFAVKGAHPGLIAYVLGKVGLPIAAMQRTRLGRIALGSLPVGQWRYLAAFEKF
ncbi:RNA pseudouridine synthase [Curvibacter sp. APW13]|uniref:RNA pseudouridine synthase n=1 Tax=Curvibacter sp. APW13 TaxID=3077236 RepID=UPI0028DE0EB6|nr:RNA pseudouridine synthase [Curvibacter sp. APW13]MDT8989818.1 RNA pseudouridine synthase [Curvibacter sp. APW13]